MTSRGGVALLLGFLACRRDGGFRLGHADGVEDFFHQLVVEELAFESDFRDRPPGLDAFLGDLRRGQIPDIRIERRGECTRIIF